MRVTESVWLAEDVISGTGVTGIVIAAIGALGAILVAYLRRDRDDDDPDPTVVINTAQPAMEAAATQASESVASIYRDELLRERREKDQLQANYDDLLARYLALVPPHPQPQSKASQ